MCIYNGKQGIHVGWNLAVLLIHAPSVLTSVSAATCRALCCCAVHPPAASYSNDGFFVSIRGSCQDSYLSAVLAFSKKTLYTTPTKAGPAPGEQPGVNATEIFKATYLTSSGWYFSLPPKDQLKDFDDGRNAFNTFVLPARPQSAKDCADPHFVMGKVCGLVGMSVMGLTGCC
jgi:hypothetical protein